jgi:hypothetical protein
VHLRAAAARRGGGLRRLGLAVAVLFALALAAGCRPGAQEAPEIALAWRVAPSPPRIGPATFSLALTDAAGRPVQGAEVRLEGNMSHPGMKPVFGHAREAEPGRYRANLEFTMAGDWFVLVEAKLPDGRFLERRLDLAGVRGRSG